jgi:integrase
MNAELKTYIQESCPTGITLRPNEKSLYVKQSKMMMVDGVRKAKDQSQVIQLGISNQMSMSEAKDEFEKALVLAIASKRKMKENFARRGWISGQENTALGTGTLLNTWNLMFPTQYKVGIVSEKQSENAIQHFNDVVEYFSSDFKLSDFTEEGIDDFKVWVGTKIAERPKNMRGTVSNNSINKRLTIVRAIMKFALKKRLLTNDQLINPDPRIKNMGIVDLKRGDTQKKPAFTMTEQEDFLRMVAKCGDQKWHDLWCWAFDLGQRHDGELDAFTVDDIDFGRGTITFYRPKTGVTSVEIPLTPRLLEIAKRLRQVAMTRKDRKLFPSTASSRRNNWERMISMCDFNQKFTPYCTRHTWITRLAEQESNPKTVMDMAGHTCIETTLTYYAKTQSPVLSKAIQNLHNQRMLAIKPKADVHSMVGHNSKGLIK